MANTTNYRRQLSQSSAYFRVRLTDLEKMNKGQYTLFDFVENSFAFSPTKREASIQVLCSLKNAPKRFSELQKTLSLKKSSLFLLLAALISSGLVEKKEKKYFLSNNFSVSMKKTAEWWVFWRDAPL